MLLENIRLRHQKQRVDGIRMFGNRHCNLLVLGFKINQALLDKVYPFHDASDFIIDLDSTYTDKF